MRGPKSAASLALSVIAPVRRLEPPPGMSDPQRRVWADVVVGVPAGHFQPSDTILLRRLCAAVAAAERIERAIDAEPDAARLGPLLDAQSKAANTIANTGAKLRLWSARYRPPGKAPPEPSPIERLRLRGLI
jgi:hypothetical protein